MNSNFLLVETRALLVVSIFLMVSLFIANNIPAATITGFFVILFLLKFRDPDRVIPSDPLAVVSPVDGRVERIERLQHPYFGSGAIRIVIDINALGAYVLRSPTEGKLIEMPARLPVQARRLRGFNVCTDEDDNVVFLLQGPWYAPPAASKRVGERIGQGERCGVLRLAHQAEVLLPANSHIRCVQGEQLLAGESILGHFVH